jgi:hypothetical protein
MNAVRPPRCCATRTRLGTQINNTQGDTFRDPMRFVRSIEFAQSLLDETFDRLRRNSQNYCRVRDGLSSSGPSDDFFLSRG